MEDAELNVAREVLSLIVFAVGSFVLGFLAALLRTWVLELRAAAKASAHLPEKRRYVLVACGNCARTNRVVLGVAKKQLCGQCREPLGQAEDTQP